MGRFIGVISVICVITLICAIGIIVLKDVGKKTTFCDNRSGIYLMPKGENSAEIVNCSEYKPVNESINKQGN